MSNHYVVYVYYPTERIGRSFDEPEEALRFRDRAKGWPDVMNAEIVVVGELELEIEQLQRWKAEATALLERMDRIHDEVPEAWQAPLGTDKIAAVETFVMEAAARGFGS